jgi:Leucine-rich repeat (LRR) protein
MVVSHPSTLEPGHRRSFLVSLPGAGLVGQLDTLSFQSLPFLTKLDISSNKHLSGQVPPSIGSLAILSTLNFSSNQFTGTIPATVGELGSLKVLDLSFNSLTGIIPQTIGRLRSLQIFHLYNSNLTGTIPP